jgi:chaperonin cofactor prefoldin|tara:strand:- start:2321 stop:2548 length:228 start_codon:yes stop_codon:yes gene_type:complete
MITNKGMAVADTQMREQIARIDERIKTMFNRQSKIEKQVEAMNVRLQEISPQIKFAERSFWIILTLGIAIYFGTN